MEPTGVDLMERVAAGDESAFDAFYDRFAGRILGLLLKAIGDRAEAEDVLQDVMCEAWRKAGNYNPALGSPDAWVLMMARARGIDRIRKLGRDRERLLAARQTIQATEQVWDEVPDADVHGVVQQALKRLPSDQRGPIVLAYYQCMTREQIAAALNIPVGTVKTRIRAGVTQLRTILAEMKVPQA